MSLQVEAGLHRERRLTQEDSCSSVTQSRVEVPLSEVGRSDPWLCSVNAAALTRYAFPNIAEAVLSATKDKGGFTDFSGSPNALSVNASVASFFRLGSRAVAYGAMSYTNFSGQHMAGSAFTRQTPSVGCAATPWPPARHLPFDIVEWTEFADQDSPSEFDKQDSLQENTGTKHQDTYRLTGAVGYDLGRGFSLGVRLDYTAANYAKYKDLRHKNKYMDLDLTAGFYLPLAIGALGANYLYHRTTESLRFSTYGKADKVYHSLIDYANFTGPVEQFGSDGFTDKSHDMPLVSDYNGASVQCSLLSFFSSFTYAHRRGYYGSRSPYTLTYTGHEGDLYRFDARLSLSGHSGSRFCLDLSLSAENLRNDAANYRTLQNEQGATYYEYYTPVKTANKLWTDGSLAFSADLSPLTPHLSPLTSHLSLPKWTVILGLRWHHREQTAYQYPFYRRQDLKSREPFLSVARNIVASRKRLLKDPAARPAFWTLAFHFSFLKGSGAPCEDLTYQQPSDKQEAPATMDAYLLREYRWLTAPQYHVGGSVAYSFILPSTQLRTFVRLSADHHKANATYEYCEGRDHTTATLAVGCRF